MPPTIQTNLNAERDKRPQRPGERRSELVCRVKYCNTLPDIPFDPKFITYPFDSTRFIQYNPTSLERNYKYEVLTEHDLGVTIDLINKDTYSGELGAQLDPADEKLLEEDVLTPQDSKRSRHHARSVSWLRRTEYISTEQTRFQPQTMDKVEAKVGYSIKKNFKDETLYMDRDSQIKAIEKTFEDSKKPIEKHYSKPNVVPVEILPLYPDFKIWKYPCAQVIFDSDPAPTGRSVPAQIEEMSQAMIRGVMDESGEQFVAYFLPTDETLEKRRRDFTSGIDYEDEEEYEYKMAREYNWNVKSKASKGYEENYFLVMRQDGIYYNELETRVRLSKRRQKVGQQPNNTRLVVKHRPLNATEFRMQRYREKQLEPPGEEDEEEEEEEEAPQAKSKEDEASQKETVMLKEKVKLMEMIAKKMKRRKSKETINQMLRKAVRRVVVMKMRHLLTRVKMKQVVKKRAIQKGEAIVRTKVRMVKRLLMPMLMVMVKLVVEVKVVAQRVLAVLHQLVGVLSQDLVLLRQEVEIIGAVNLVVILAVVQEVIQTMKKTEKPTSMDAIIVFEFWSFCQRQ